LSSSRVMTAYLLLIKVCLEWYLSGFVVKAHFLFLKFLIFLLQFAKILLL